MVSYSSRLAYVRSVGLVPVDPSKMDKREALLWILLSKAAFQGTYRAIYVPFDVNTGQLPSAEPKWEEKTITQGNGKVAVWTSPNLWAATFQFFTQRVCGQRNPNLPGPRLPVPDTACVDVVEKIPVMMADYSVVLGYKYAGQNRPPDRSLKAQLTDWQNGVLLARVHLPNDSISEEEIEAYERAWGVKVQRGWYWVAYESSLALLPGALATADFAVLAVRVTDACKKYLFGIIKKCPKLDQVLAETVRSLRAELTPLGFAVDTERVYTYNGMKLKGPHIFKAGGDSYTVVVPVKRVGSLGIPIALVWAIVVLVALIIAYAIAVKISSVEAVYAEAEKERAETYQQYVNFVTSVCKDPNNPACYKALQNVTAVAQASKPSSQKTSSVLGDVEKLGYIAVAGIAAYALMKAVENWKESRR